jgi:tRNA-modifying protein YgfZ
MVGPSTFAKQYDTLRRGDGFVVLPDWSSVTITGDDQKKFLHNFCTNDVNSLQPGECREAFFANAKGRVLGHGLIDCCDDELVFVGAPNQAFRLVEHLDRYIIRDDVQLRDTSGERAYVLGPPLLPVVAPDCPIALKPIGIGGSILCARCALSTVATNDLSRARRYLTSHGYEQCDTAVFEAIRIESGTPLFGIDFGEENFPQEVNRDRHAISFTKGCYLGQETVARIDALGHVNQKLVGVRFTGSELPVAGAELMKDGARAGRVTSAAYSPQLGAPIALAMVRREANAIGTGLESPVGACEVISLPLSFADK